MWDLVKRIFHFLSTILLYSIFIILILVSIMVGLYFLDNYTSAKKGIERAPLFGAYVIISPSMVPNINVMDAVITMRVDAKDIHKKDVITFTSEDPRNSGITVTHRVVGINKTESGTYAYRTKGDNNNVEDRTLVSYDQVIGKVMLRIPYIGYLQQLLTTQFGWILVIVLPCLFIIIGDLVKLMKALIVGPEKPKIGTEAQEEEEKKKGFFHRKKEEKKNDSEKQTQTQETTSIIDDHSNHKFEKNNGSFSSNKFESSSVKPSFYNNNNNNYNNHYNNNYKNNFPQKNKNKYKQKHKNKHKHKR